MAGKSFTVVGSTQDGTYQSDSTPKFLGECELSYIKFKDAAGAVVTPTDGTVTVQFSPEGTIWRNGDNSLFDAKDVYGPDESMPYAQGSVLYARLVLLGVTGNNVTNFEAVFWRRT